jgi:hypothetical protein
MLTGRSRTWSILAVATLCGGLMVYLFAPPRQEREPGADGGGSRTQTTLEEEQAAEAPMSPHARRMMRSVTAVAPFFLQPYNPEQ